MFIDMVWLQIIGKLDGVNGGVPEQGCLGYAMHAIHDATV